MAEIVLGIGSSHGPLLSTPPEQWDLRAKADRANKQHAYRGKTYDFEGLLKERAPGFAREIGIETRRERYARCQSALDALGRKFKDVAPEAFVVRCLNPGKNSAAVSSWFAWLKSWSARASKALAEAIAPIPSVVAFLRRSRRGLSGMTSSLLRVRALLGARRDKDI